MKNYTDTKILANYKTLLHVKVILLTYANFNKYNIFIANGKNSKPVIVIIVFYAFNQPKKLNNIKKHNKKLFKKILETLKEKVEISNFYFTLNIDFQQSILRVRYTIRIRRSRAFRNYQNHAHSFFHCRGRVNLMKIAE